MKIGIVGDLHISSSFSTGKIDPQTQLNTRLRDFIATFNGIIDEFERRDIKLVVLTGDVCDKRNPNPIETNQLSKALVRAVGKGMKILMVAGNHDQTRSSNTTSVDIFNSLGLTHIISFPDYSVYTTQDEAGQDVNIVMLPYRDKGSFNVATTDEAITIIKHTIQNIKSGVNGRTIALCHMMLDHTITGQTSETFSLNELVLPLSVFDGFDAVFTGHIHKSEVLRESPPVVVCGSMDRLTFGEREHNKLSIIYDTTANTYETISNNVRDLWEISVDYSDGPERKAAINDLIVADIEEFARTHTLEGSIVKLVAKVRSDDSFHVQQDRLKELIWSYKVENLASVQISTVSVRTLRNSNITENTSSKKAMGEFIRGLTTETENIKKRLLKSAEEIIELVDGK